jgi:hypothetical protein
MSCVIVRALCGGQVTTRIVELMYSVTAHPEDGQK